MKEHVRDNIKIVPAFTGEAKINKWHPWPSELGLPLQRLLPLVGEAGS